jgi:hypothetical protein
MEMQTDKLGWIAAVLFLICCCYFILKKVLIRHSQFKINLRQALNLHCYIGLIGTVIAILHVGKNISFLGLSAGFICLFSMILLSISGIVMKYIKGIPQVIRKEFKCAHIILTIIFVVSLLYHIYLYHFYMS